MESWDEMDTAGHPVQRARDFLHCNYARRVTLQQLAELTGLSRYYLVRAFAKRFGRPPHAYKLYLQVQRAKALLESGALPAFVASETGFSDQSHLTRQFKKMVGVTPRRYLLERRNGAS